MLLLVLLGLVSMILSSFFFVNSLHQSIVGVGWWIKTQLAPTTSTMLCFFGMIPWTSMLLVTSFSENPPIRLQKTTARVLPLEDCHITQVFKDLSDLVILVPWILATPRCISTVCLLSHWPSRLFACQQYLGDHHTRSFEIPSGYVKIAIENGHRNSEFSHSTWWFSNSPTVNVYQAGYPTLEPKKDQHQVTFLEKPLQGHYSCVFITIRRFGFVWKWGIPSMK